MAPLAQLTAAATRVEVEAAWTADGGAGEMSGRRVAPETSVRGNGDGKKKKKEKREPEPGEVKDCCSGVESKPLLYLSPPASRQKQHRR